MTPRPGRPAPQAAARATRKSLPLVSRFLAYLQRLRQHRVSRNALWIFLGQGANFFLQALFFVLLTRLLGVTEYGIFSGAFALISLVTPYSSLGAGMLFMRYVTADRSQAAVYWGNTLLVTTAVSTVIAIVFAFAGPAITHTPSRLIFVMLAFANCLFSQISDLGSRVFQTVEKMRTTAVLSFLTNAARVLVMIVMLFSLHRATAVQWSVGVLIASGAGALLAVLWVRRETGPLAFNTRLVFKRAWEGVGFSFAGTTQNAYNDIDKTMLSHYGLNRENGFYSLAYRIVDFGTTPVVAIDSAVLPSFFRHSRKDMAKTVRLALKSAAASILIGLAIAIGILLFAPVVLRLVPKGFSGALIALHWLCWLPLLRGIHRMTGGALTGSGRQTMRTVAQFCVAGGNFLLNLWWIPIYGWIGAAWASVAADGALAVLNSLMLLWLWNRIGRPASVTAMEAAQP